jgi:hypothetical protein
MANNGGWLERPENIKKLKIAFGIVLAVLTALDFVIHKHTHFSMENIPGFYVLFGFLSCVVIIAVSKTVGKLWLTRGEDYYDD